MTGPIQAGAHACLDKGLAGLRRLPLAQALLANTTHRYDQRSNDVDALDQVLDPAAIRHARLLAAEITAVTGRSGRAWRRCRQGR